MDFWDFFWILAIWIPLLLLWGFTLVDLFGPGHFGVAKALWAIVKSVSGNRLCTYRLS